MKALIFSEKSLEDLDQILRIIAKDKPEAARRFVEKLKKQCEFLAHFPDVGTLRDDLATGLRLFTFRGYGIYFHPSVDQARIERVLHGSLDVMPETFE
jgi:toxin ParE1/3/4